MASLPNAEGIYMKLDLVIFNLKGINRSKKFLGVGWSIMVRLG